MWNNYFISHVFCSHFDVAHAQLWVITITKRTLAEIVAVGHCVKSVNIWSYSGRYFPAFGLNTERHGVCLRIQSKRGKTRARITPNTDTFHAVPYLII